MYLCVICKKRFQNILKKRGISSSFCVLDKLWQLYVSDEENCRPFSPFFFLAAAAYSRKSYFFLPAFAAGNNDGGKYRLFGKDIPVAPELRRKKKPNKKKKKKKAPAKILHFYASIKARGSPRQFPYFLFSFFFFSWEFFFYLKFIRWLSDCYFLLLENPIIYFHVSELAYIIEL